MTQHDVFASAQWVAAGIYTHHRTTEEDSAPHFPVLRSYFSCEVGAKVNLRVLGLGFFHCYINGKEVTDARFLPLSSDYEERENYPVGEKLHGHRIYVPEFEVSALTHPGRNTIVLTFGGGWYTYLDNDARYGDPKAIWRITVNKDGNINEFFSGEDCLVSEGLTKTYNLTMFEAQDYTRFDEGCLKENFDDSTWAHAIPAVPIKSDYLFSDCPVDRVIEKITPVLVREDENGKTYTCGRNITGYPILKMTAPYGETVRVIFSENLLSDGTIDMNYHHSQVFSCVSDGKEHLVHPDFTWFGFSCFRVEGAAQPIEIDFIHFDAPALAEFTCENETLNWLYETFLNTERCNMHAGLISDCPHLERRGYTGDGQLTGHAVMTLLDTEAFYRKWVEDISDCQDILTGHIQYTAPYVRSGGGPGAWGAAVCEVPYQIWRHYGDPEPAKKLYPQMLAYFAYMEAHSENDLVTSDQPEAWCLGDWCPPIQVVLPAPFVNNYYYVKAMEKACRIAPLLGREEDIPLLNERIARKKAAMTAAYFNTWDGNFIGGLQGANAFAVDIGLGNQHTYDNMVKYYRELGRYDTGICGTEVVTRVLFEHGDGDLALTLMTSQEDISFDGMRRRGATTFWENWPMATWDRSRNHPMFGAVTVNLVEWLMGIRRPENAYGDESLIIAPFFTDRIGTVSGTLQAGSEKISLTYRPEGGNMAVEITLEGKIPILFRYKDITLPLQQGNNAFSIESYNSGKALLKM